MATNTAPKKTTRKPKDAAPDAAATAPLYEVNKQWFLDQMADHQLNATHVAKVLGIDKSALSLILSGRRRLKTEEAASLALHLGASLADVLANAGVDLRGVARPTVSVPLPSGRVIKLEIPPGVTPKDWELASAYLAQYIAATTKS